MTYSTPPPITQEYVCCGGYSDKDGITWSRVGSYWATPGENLIKADEKFCTWYPSLSEAAVQKDGAMGSPPEESMSKKAWKEYQRLLLISEPYEVIIDGKKFIKGRIKHGR